MIVPEGRRRAGTGMVPSRNHRYAVCGCTPLRRAQSASFMRPILTLTYSYVCSRKSEQMSTPQIQLLTSIPGIGDRVAAVVISEIGVDMSRFPSAKHLAAWAGLAP